MATTYKELLAAAHAAVPKVTAAEAAGLVEKAGALIVDVRDGTEVQASGKAKGAIAVPRGSLESRADPDSPNHNPPSARTARLSCTAPAVGARRWPARRCATWASPMSAIWAASGTG